jgi:hypothetical protein
MTQAGSLLEVLGQEVEHVGAPESGPALGAVETVAFLRCGADRWEDLEAVRDEARSIV